MTNQSDAGPGELTSEFIGQRTIAKSYPLTPRQIMAYAASVGDSNPAYFDDLRSEGLIGHPFMAYSFQWNTRFMPQVPDNPRASPFTVHATTDLRLHRPFQEGDLITSQGRFISIRQVKPGVLQLSRFTLSDGAGSIVAELDIAGITRGATLKGNDIALEDEPAVPVFTGKQSLCWQKEIYISPEAAQTYTECAQIYNPIHTERRVAKAAGLPDIILHGSATQAMSLSQIIDRSLGGDPSRVRRYIGQLRAMVLMDSTITVRCLGESESDDGKKLILFDVLNQAGEQAVANGLVVAE